MTIDDMNNPDAIIQTLKNILGPRKDIPLALLYGSAASDTLHAGSDLDVAVSAGRVLSPEERLELSTDLLQATGREVDLLDIETAEGLILHEICCNNILLKKYCAVLMDNRCIACVKAFMWLHFFQFVLLLVPCFHLISVISGFIITIEQIRCK